MIPLGLLCEGEKGEIVNTINNLCHGRKAFSQIENMGLRDGFVVEILKNEGRGPLLLKVNESRIAIGRCIAMKILVRRLPS